MIITFLVLFIITPIIIGFIKFKKAALSIVFSTFQTLDYYFGFSCRSLRTCDGKECDGTCEEKGYLITIGLLFAIISIELNEDIN